MSQVNVGDFSKLSSQRSSVRQLYTEQEADDMALPILKSKSRLTSNLSKHYSSQKEHDVFDLDVMIDESQIAKRSKQPQFAIQRGSEEEKSSTKNIHNFAIEKFSNFTPRKKKSQFAPELRIDDRSDKSSSMKSTPKKRKTLKINVMPDSLRKQLNKLDSESGLTRDVEMEFDRNNLLNSHEFNGQTGALPPIQSNKIKIQAYDSSSSNHDHCSQRMVNSFEAPQRMQDSLEGPIKNQDNKFGGNELKLTSILTYNRMLHSNQLFESKASKNKFQSQIFKKNKKGYKRTQTKKNTSFDDKDICEEYQRTKSQTTQMNTEGSYSDMMQHNTMHAFTMLSQMPLNLKKKPRCIILPTSKSKLFWDVFILTELLLVSILVPFRLAYYPTEDKTWEITYLIMDSFFLVDIIVTFFSATIDPVSSQFIMSKTDLAKHYLKFWFWVDLFAILPLDFIMTSGGEANILLRFAKIGKLYKLIRLSRLAKLFKLLKGQNAVYQQLSSSMTLSSGVERLVFIAIFGIFFLHISSCLFVFLVEFDPDIDNVWSRSEAFNHYSTFDMYVTSIYYVVTTMSTVGYGDISGGTAAERVFCIALMLTGVMSFNLISGALGALITNYDSNSADHLANLMQLDILKVRYHISDELYFQIRNSLQFDYSKNMTGLENFINSLPDKLRLDISEEIHRQNFKKFTLFSGIGGKNFISWVASKLRPRFDSDNVFVYQKGDQIDNFYFGIKGTFLFVIPEMRNAICGVVDPEKVRQSKNSNPTSLLQFFGMEDSVVNTTAQIHDSLFIDDCYQFSENGIRDLRKRFFSVMSITMTEVLHFSSSNIDEMKRSFPQTSKEFFRKMISQTKFLLFSNLSTLRTGDTAHKPLLKHTMINKTLDKGKKKESLESRNLKIVSEYINGPHVKIIENFSTLCFSSSSSSFDSCSYNDGENSQVISNQSNRGAKDEELSNMAIERQESCIQEFKPNQKSTPWWQKLKQNTESQKRSAQNQSPFRDLSHMSDPSLPVSVYSSPELIQKASKITALGSPRRHNNTEMKTVEPIELNHYNKSGSSEKTEPNSFIKSLQQITAQNNPSVKAIEKSPRSTYTEPFEKKQRSKTVKFKTPNRNANLTPQIINVGNLKDEDEEVEEKPVSRQKSYDLYARQKFQKKMKRRLSKQLTSAIDFRFMQSKKTSAPLTYSTPKALTVTNLDSSRQSKDSHNSIKSFQPFQEEDQQYYTTQQVPQLNLDYIGGKKVRRMTAASRENFDDSEYRDNVESLRESRVPLAKSESVITQPATGSLNSSSLQKQLLKVNRMKSVDQAFIRNKDQKTKHRRTTSKETELQFTRRLVEENPRGLKGLAYVLMEIRRAIDQGIIKPSLSKNTKDVKTAKLASIFNRQAKTRLQHSEKIQELINTLDEEKIRITDHLLKEQDFENVEPVVERAQMVMVRYASQQREQLDSFFSNINQSISSMKNDMMKVKSKVDILMNERSTIVSPTSN